MTQHYRAVVVGGGIVGTSVLYWLTKLGWTDVALLERRELTSGSTWHAAGNTTFFGHYPAITQLFVNSVKTYLAAEAETGHGVGFHDAGSLRLATTERELEFYHGLEPLYDEMDVPYHVVGPDRVRELHPLLQAADILGAAHTPTDGHVDPTGATQALAAAARQRGAKVRRWCPVETLSYRSGTWHLATSEDPFTADHVVLATSFWTRELVQPLGLNLPLYPLQHHELITEDIPELAALNFEVPTIRDPVVPSNTRQERDGFLCGIYEQCPEFWAVDGIPRDFTEELLPNDIARLEPHLETLIARIPAFGEAGIRAIHNGPICYTPDGLPLLGPVESHPGLWLAAGFAIGIGTGGGSAEFLSRWLVEGAPPADLPVVHPSRFTNDVGREAALEMIRRTYAAGYALPET